MGHPRRLLDVGDQIAPGGREALVGLGFGSTFHQGLDHASRRYLLTPPVEDLFLELGDQGVGLVAERDRELRHRG